MNASATDLFQVCDKLKEQLGTWLDAHGVAAQVTIAEPTNEDPTRCPWVGIYPLTDAFVPRALGVGQNIRLQTASILVLAQTAHVRSGEDCARELGALAKQVVSAILSDESVGGTLLELVEVSARYNYERERSSAQFMQTALITLDVTAPVEYTA